MFGGERSAVRTHGKPAGSSCRRLSSSYVTYGGRCVQEKGGKTMLRRYAERDERSYDQDYNSEREFRRDYDASGRDLRREEFNRRPYGGEIGRGYERDYGQRDYTGGYSGSETNRPFGNYGREMSSGSSYGRGSYGSRFGRGDYERGYGNREEYRNRAGEERGWWDRASDEVSSWFGDEEAERRRLMDEQRAGQHRGRGPRGYRRSDDRIEEDVNDRLSDHEYLDASDVEVSVDNSEVTLSGTVNGRYEKRLAEDIAESVSGVTHVQNNLRVNRTRYGTSPTETIGRSATATSATGTTAASGAAAGMSPTGTQRTK